jgi:DNA mismatch endonuclease, patch repair protein
VSDGAAVLSCGQMVDVVDKKTRSRMMSGIRGRNTQPEHIVRRALHARGYRFRLHDRTLPGCPDLVFPRYRSVIFVHGCFWHRHLCRIFKWPSTNRKFWRDKIEGNASRDLLAIRALRKGGWRVLVVWECSIRHSSSHKVLKAMDRVESWLTAAK